MNETITLVTTLTVVCIVSAAILALVYERTKPLIEEANIGELRKSLEEVLPSAATFSELTLESPLIDRTFKGGDNNGNVVGVAYLTSAKGYQDYIKILVGVDFSTKAITRIKILEHTETPGLGSRIEDSSFLGTFAGKSDVGNIDAITGATVSSTGVIKAVEQSLPLISMMIDEGEIT